MKKILAIMLVMIMMVSLVGCGNQQLFDATYTFDYAIIKMPNGEIVEGKVDSWNDYEGEQLQIKINGVTYLTHSENVVMIAK
jgi:uncharacterized lipoprotein YehR (DUF1307 family)